MPSIQTQLCVSLETMFVIFFPRGATWKTELLVGS